MQRRNFLKTTGGAAASLSLTGCLGTLLGEENQDNSVTIGSDIPFPPFEFYDDNENVTGFDYDIAQAVFGDEMGYDVEFQATEWASIIQDLQSERFDVIMSAMTINETRAKRVDFSDPYFKAFQTVLVREDSDIQAVDDLRGKDVAVQQGTTGETAANDLMGDFDGDLTVHAFDDGTTAYERLGNQQADAVIADDLVNWQAMGNYDVRFLEGDGVAAEQNDPDAPPYYTLSIEEYGIAFRREDDEFRQEVNEALAAVKEDGRYDEVYSKYTDQLPER